MNSLWSPIDRAPQVEQIPELRADRKEKRMPKVSERGRVAIVSWERAMKTEPNCVACTRRIPNSVPCFHCHIPRRRKAAFYLCLLCVRNLIEKTMWEKFDAENDGGNADAG